MSQPKPTLDDLRIERRPERESTPKSWILPAALILLIVAVAAWWWLRPKAVAVHVVAARELSAASSADHTVLNASGYVVARRRATVSSKVTEVLIEEGMKVKEGQVLARLDDSNTKASLDLAQAQLDSAKTALDETRALLKQAEQEFVRITDLAKQKIVSASDRDRAESDATSLRG